MEYPELDCDYWRFVGALIEAALELNPMERADSTLRELIRAARQALPSVRHFFSCTVCLLIRYTISMLLDTLLTPRTLNWPLWPVSSLTAMARAWKMTYDPLVLRYMYSCSLLHPQCHHFDYGVPMVTRLNS